MRYITKASMFLVMALLVFFSMAIASEHKKTDASLSPQTQACIGCHETYTPGIVQDWLSSRHSRVIPADAIKKPALERRVSADKIKDEFAGYVVGCYECHSSIRKNTKIILNTWVTR